MTQAERFSALAVLTRKPDQLDVDYRAAFYLLTNDAEIFTNALDFVSWEGVDFKGMKRAARRLPESKQIIMDIAHNLFTYNSTCKATPYEISRLGDDLIDQVFTAIRISSGQLKLDLKEENRTPVLHLDSSPPGQKKAATPELATLIGSKTTNKHQEEQGKDLLLEVSHLHKKSLSEKVTKMPLEL